MTAPRVACSLPGCEQPSRIRTLCQKHYDQARHGTGDFPLPPRKTFAPPSACVVEHCANSATSGEARWCLKHYTRYLRHGDVHTVKPFRSPAARIGYRAAHTRVVRERGPAAAQRCVDCGAPADDWSYAYTAGSHELTDSRGWAYSPRPADYEPRCRPDHIDHDAAIRAQRGVQTRRQVTAALTARRVLTLLQSQPGATVAEVSAATHLSITAVRGALRRLAANSQVRVNDSDRPVRYVVREEGAA